MNSDAFTTQKDVNVRSLIEKNNSLALQVDTLSTENTNLKIKLIGLKINSN